MKMAFYECHTVEDLADPQVVKLIAKISEEMDHLEEIKNAARMRRLGAFKSDNQSMSHLAA